MRQLVTSHHLLQFHELITSSTSQEPRGLDGAFLSFFNEDLRNDSLKERNLHVTGQLLWARQAFIETHKSPKAPHENHFLKKIPYSRGQGGCRNLHHMGAANGKTKVGEVKANCSEDMCGQ